MNNLKNIRRRFGLTRKTVAAVMGVTTGMVGHYEHMRYEIPPRTARKLVDWSHGAITFDDIYRKPLPELAVVPQKAAA